MFSLVFAVPALGQGVEDLSDGNAARGWQGVGRLLLGQRGFCTGALISPQEVLTAAHCLFDPETGARLPLHSIHFQAGWRHGRAEAYRGVQQSRIAPEYIYSGAAPLGRIPQDLALLTLDQPIRLPQIAPFALAAVPEPTTAQQAVVDLVSYGAERAEAARWQAACHILGQQSGVMILDCGIEPGSSGAPVFLRQPQGAAEGAALVAVISAQAELQGKAVALAAPVAPAIAALRALSPDRTADPGRGAKFLRP